MLYGVISRIFVLNQILMIYLVKPLISPLIVQSRSSLTFKLLLSYQFSYEKKSFDLSMYLGSENCVVH